MVLTEAQRLAEKARQGLRMVASGEDRVIDGWLIYGAALQAGRKLFSSNNKFHDWIVSSQLVTTDRHDEAAAMSAAEDEPAFWSFRLQHSRVRTVRGLHAKWKEA